MRWFGRCIFFLDSESSLASQPPGTRKKVSRNPYTRSTTTPPPNSNISGEKKEPLAPDDMTELETSWVVGSGPDVYYRVGIYRHRVSGGVGSPLASFRHVSFCWTGWVLVGIDGLGHGRFRRNITAVAGSDRLIANVSSLLLATLTRGTNRIGVVCVDWI